jgi:hypothetical protein
VVAGFLAEIIQHVTDATLHAHLTAAVERELESTILTGAQS